MPLIFLSSRNLLEGPIEALVQSLQYYEEKQKIPDYSTVYVNDSSEFMVYILGKFCSVDLTSSNYGYIFCDCTSRVRVKGRWYIYFATYSEPLKVVDYISNDIPDAIACWVSLDENDKIVVDYNEL